MFERRPLWFPTRRECALLLPKFGVSQRPLKQKSEERELVVDSGASMHRLSRKDLNSEELATVQVSRTPTTLVTANGKVQSNEEATVYVKELDLLVTVKLLEGTQAVLSLRKLCEDHGYSYEWISNHASQRMAKSFSITRRTTCHSLSRVYRLALPAPLHLNIQHRCCRTLRILPCVQQQHEVRM